MVFEFFCGWSWNTVDVLRPQIREAFDLSPAAANASVIALGVAYGMFAEREDWRALLLLGSVPALVLQPLILFLVPDDQKMTSRGAETGQPGPHRVDRGLLLGMV